ncbi:MAG: ABC transporter ATP-binding protein [Myxococcota bacterium]|jgi:lipoprotein-releasing system ATP-binding protein|nr:ABC transporter ATP-binding protein [Myxococcota bacterium]
MSDGGVAGSAGAGQVPLVEVKGLWKRFQSGERTIEVLRGVDLEIQPGESLAIVGQSGIGKSTLLHVLGGLDAPSAGSVLFRGEDLFAKDGDERAAFRNASLGFVFQFHHLLPEFSALENVMMPGLLRGLGFDVMRASAAEMLREVELGERLDHRVGKLSGGERQRVALARALVLQPTLVLADEPTGNLDPATGDRIGELLLAMNRTRGTALVVVTHSERLAARMGRVLILRDGVLLPATT